MPKGEAGLPERGSFKGIPRGSLKRYPKGSFKGSFNGVPLRVCGMPSRGFRVVSRVPLKLPLRGFRVPLFL